MLREVTYVLKGLLFYDFLLSIILTGCDGCIEKAIVSLYRAGEEKPIERYKTRFKVAEENKLFSSFPKKILSSLSGLNETRAKWYARPYKPVH